MAEDLEVLKHGEVDAYVDDLFLRRWSPRAFSEKCLNYNDLRSIFSAGIWAASSYNEQPWRFLLGRDGNATWQGIFDALAPGNQAWTHTAPVLFASFAKKTSCQDGSPNPVAQHDVGAASAQISLQATALGLHTHGMVGFDADKLRVRFKVPDDFTPVACWAVGYLGDPDSLNDKQREMEMQPRERKPLAELVFAEWGTPAL